MSRSRRKAHVSGGLRIGMVAPPWFQLPPTGYGGIEAVVADLVAQLVRRGHEVHLVAAGPHRTAAQHHHASFDRPPSGRLGESFPEVIHAAYAAEVLAGLDLDLVHDHSLAGVLSARGRPVPTLVTMHGPATGDYGRIIGLLGRTVRLVAISDAQRASAPGLPWIGRVHNGIDVASYPLVTDKDDYLLWLGRFTRDKGPHVAIDVARAVGRRIVLAGKLIEPDEQAFFRAEIEPRLGPGVEYVGEADAVRKRQLFSRARCLVFPLQWDEPFGIVMAEAMACGTPVVALRRGSVPEVVEHEVAGFVVDSVEELCAAVDTCDDLDPKACREVASRRFDLSVMADGYERAYHALLTGRPTTVSAPAAPSVTRRAPISA